MEESKKSTKRSNVASGEVNLSNEPNFGIQQEEEEEAAPELRLVYRAEDVLINDFVENMCTVDQRERWYAFRRVKFSHAIIKKLASQITGATSLPKNLPMVISAVSRTYLSQILDEARNAMRDFGDDPFGTMAPHHLREGYRRYHAKHSAAILQPRHRKRLF